MAKKPLEKVIADLKAKHENNGYDYSLITENNYIDTHHKVPIICKEHGVFYQTPHAHKQGQGCPTCANAEKRKNKNVPKKLSRRNVFGVGVFDSDLSCYNEEIRAAYFCWANMLRRCYDKKYHANKPTYVGCSVCDKWLLFSNFKHWFDENYISGYQLDKDILVKGNKVYSPETCCFVPAEINTLLLNDKSKRKRKDTPLGVVKSQNTFIVRFSKQGKNYYIGSFKNINNAFKAYKQAKEQYIKEIAQNYYNQGKITEKVYDALMNYKININE